MRDPSTGAWRLVSWIDSKATFGDDATHSRQMEEQYSTYLHRYGPGLVIYWFGCLDDLAVQVCSREVAACGHYMATRCGNVAVGRHPMTDLTQEIQCSICGAFAAVSRTPT